MRRFLILAAAGLLAGCMTPPYLGPAPEVKAPQTYRSADSFTAAPTPWPSDTWWTAYGDPQLSALIDEALANAPTMAQASARLRRAEALVGSANAALLPSISADGSLTVSKPSVNDGIPVLPERRGYHDYGRATLGFGWELDFWGRNRAALAAATSDAQAAGADAAAARLIVSASVAATYADLVRLYNDRDVLAETLRVREKSLALVQMRVEQGFDSDADLAQAQAGPPAVRSDLAQADEAIGLTRNRLAALLGAGPDRGRRIDRPNAPALKGFGLPSNLSADLLGHRPDIVAARWRVEAAGKRIKVAKAQFYPNINLMGLIGFESLGIGNLLDGGSDIGAAGPAISLPIFDGGRRRAHYRGARADYDAAVASYDETLTQALRDVADVAVSSRQLAEEMQGADAALSATERAYRLARLRYTQGASDYQSVLLVEDRLLQRRRIVAALQSRNFILDVALIRSLGGGVMR
ncbi:efflux transporter outer membrane subunit [Sphingobium sp.]|uniref:efflux transporter outer membrane subunit n=1 Tax=Sphingobium sp. TaxID=1912891 RepID=UPI003B3B8093